MEQLEEQIQVKQLLLTAQSMEADRRGADQKELEMQRQKNKKADSKVMLAGKGKSGTLSSKSPSTSARNKSNAKVEPNSSQVLIQESRSPGNSTTVVMGPNATASSKNSRQTQGVDRERQTGSPSQSSRRSKGRKEKVTVRKTSTVTATAGTAAGGAALMKSGKSGSSRHQVMTPEKYADAQKESQRTIWEQPRNPFIVAKTVHRIFNNAHVTLNQMQYQPQASCPIYTRLKERVSAIDARQKQREQRLCLAQQHKKGPHPNRLSQQVVLNQQESRELAITIQDQDSVQSGTRLLSNATNKSRKTPKKSQNNLVGGTGGAAARKVIPQVMPTVSEFCELSQDTSKFKDLPAAATIITENVQASVQSMQTEVPPQLPPAMEAKEAKKAPRQDMIAQQQFYLSQEWRNEKEAKKGANLLFVRQQTQAPPKTLKEITEMSKISQVDEMSAQLRKEPVSKFADDFGSVAKTAAAYPHQVAVEDQKNWEAELDKAMLSKLVRGEKAGGKFSRIKHESQEQKESCVFQLGQFQPRELRQRRNQHSLSHVDRQDMAKRAFLEGEAKRNARLDLKMKQVVAEARFRLGTSPKGKFALQSILDNLGMDCEMVASDDESDWSVVKEMKKFRATAKHRKDFEHRMKQKMVKMGKIKHENELQHVDSLIESAYNSQKASSWGAYRETPGPRQSLQSEEEFDVFSNSDESQDSDHSLDIIEQIKKERKLTLTLKNNPMDEMKMAMLGFEPGFAVGGNPELVEQVKAKIFELNGVGTQIPEATSKVIYKKLCNEFQTAPIDVFKKVNKEKTALTLENYGLNEQQAKPISLIIPYMQELEQITLKDCNLNDASAAIIIQSSLGNNSKVRRLNLSGVEMGSRFIKRLKKQLKQSPESLRELIMSNLRPAVSIGRLLETLQGAITLEYLDLSENVFNHYSVDALGDFIKTTRHLEYLNLNTCGLRGQVAEKVMDAIMLNKTIKYLDMNNNRFSCKNYMIAAKLGRALQGHPKLLHVDISESKLVREELLFLIMCVRDSKNIQGIHLSGNKVKPHDRILMRALLQCKTKWPLPPQYAPKFEKISGTDKITLVMLNLFFMMAVPPSYIAEIGLSEVNSVQEVREKIKSFERTKMFEDEIKWKNEKEYSRTEVHYKELVEKTLEHVIEEKTRELEEAVKQAALLAAQEEGEPAVARDFKKYYADPDARLYDMFTMIDFYGLKRRCLELGVSMQKEEDKWYRDQRHRLQQRIQGLREADPRSVSDYFEQMIQLREQLADLRFLGPPEKKSSEMPQKELEKGSISERTLSTDDNMSELDDLILPPMFTDPDFEEQERMLEKKLKRIQKDKQEEKEREAVIYRQQQDKDVIKRVKKLIKLTPENVPELGAFANPMRQHKDALIFTRVTGHPNALDNGVWFDTSECWVCAEHSKVSLKVALADRVRDSEFTQIIMLTAMMTKRAQKRIEHIKESDKALFETMLEEKSQRTLKSESMSETSGSGPDIQGEGDPAYRNQEKINRRKHLFRDQKQEERGIGAQTLMSGDGFGSQDDDASVNSEQDDSKEQLQQDKLMSARRMLQTLDKADQARSENFRMYTEPKNLIQVTSHFSKTIKISEDPKSNLTLFNPSLTAKPIQLKNVLKSVYQEYQGADGPDRFNQTSHRYHAHNGVLYRNLHNSQQISEGLSRAASRRQGTSVGFGSTALDRRLPKKLEPGSNTSSRVNQHSSTLDLTDQCLMFKTDKMLTKFDIPDSMIAKQIENLQEKEQFLSQQEAANGHLDDHKQQLQSHLFNSARKAEKGVGRVSMQREARSNWMHADSSTYFNSSHRQNNEQALQLEEMDAHQAWLAKRGIGPCGQMPPLRIKASGNQYQPSAISLLKMAQGASCPHRNIIDTSKVSLKDFAISSGRRQVQTSHFQTRAGRSMQNMQQQRRFAHDFSAKKANREKQVKQNRSTHIAYNPKVRPKLDLEDNYKQFWALFNQKEELDAMYMVSSVNHWMPIKLVDSELLSKQVEEKLNPPESQTQPLPGSRDNNNEAIGAAAPNADLQSNRSNSTYKKERTRANLNKKLTSLFLGTNETAGEILPEDEDPMERKLRLEQDSFQRFTIQKNNPRVEQCKGHTTDLIGRQSCVVKKVQNIDEPQIKARRQPPRRQQLERRSYGYNDSMDFECDRSMEVNMFCRPGRHHFFFVGNSKHFMLSNKYPMERFKETNVVMNYIDVPMRGWRIGRPMIDRDAEWQRLCEQTAAGDQSFDKSRSVFKNFRLDTPVLIEKMFENDLRLTKIPHKIKDKDQLQKVKVALHEHYDYIRNLFLVLSCDSSYPAVNRTDFDIWALNCELTSKPGVDEAKINLQREGALVKNELTKKISDGTTKNDMLRFQFLEVIFRLTELCYGNEIKQESSNNTGAQPPKQPKKKKGEKSGGKIYLFQAINRFMKEHVCPYSDQFLAEHANLSSWRTEHIYTYKVNYFYERNESIMKRLHSEYNYAGKYYLSPVDAVNFVTASGGITFLKERLVVRLYGSSKQSVIDYVKTPSSPKELSFVEFLEFFARVAYATFLVPNEKYSELPMGDRVDALLAHYCKKKNINGMLSSLKEDMSGLVDEVIEWMKDFALREVMQNQDSQQLNSESIASQSQLDASDNVQQKSKSSVNRSFIQFNRRENPLNTSTANSARSQNDPLALVSPKHASVSISKDQKLEAIAAAAAAAAKE